MEASLKSEDTVDENTSEETQQANAFLRERFLYLISSITDGKLCKINMYDKTKVEAKLKAFDLNFENVIVENLKTPLPDPIKTAKLRTSDIITISFVNPK